MLVTEAINDIRHKISDTDEINLKDSELLAYLNEAAQFISTYLISAISPMAVYEVIIEDAEYEIPQNFVKPCGKYPIKTTGNKIELLDDPPMKFRYFATVPKLELEDEMPFFHDALNQYTIKLACIYAGNRDEFDESQDRALLEELKQALAQLVV